MYQDYYDEDFQQQASETKTPKGIKKSDRKTQEVPLQKRNQNTSLPKVKNKGAVIRTLEEDLNKTKKKDKQSKLSLRGQSVDKLMHFSKDQGRSKAKSNKNSTGTKQKGDIQIQNDQKQLRHHSKSTFTLDKQNFKSRVLLKQGNLRKQLTLGKNCQRLSLRTTLTTQVQKIQKYFSQNKEDLKKMKDDQINRLNNKVREWIKRVSQDLDRKIGEAIRQRQSVPQKKEKQKSNEEVVNLISSQIVNNEDTLRLLQNQQEQLLLKQQSIGNEDYDLELQEEKNKLKKAIVVQKKNILSLKQNSVRLSGKLRTQTIPAQFSKKIQSLKEKILIQKSLEAKNQEIINKLDSQLSELENRRKYEDQVYQKLIIQAKVQHISVSDNFHIHEKLTSVREKISKLKGLNLNVQNIANRTAQQIQHQTKLIRQEIRQYEKDFSNTEELINKNISKALNLIQTNQTLLSTRSPQSNAVIFFTQQKNQNHSSIYMPTALIKPQNKKKNETELEKREQGKKQQLALIRENSEEKIISRSHSIEGTYVQEYAENQFIDMEPSATPSRIWQDKEQQDSQKTPEETQIEPAKLGEEQKLEENHPIFPKRFKRRLQPKYENQGN